jgi:hypothetical protein
MISLWYLLDSDVQIECLVGRRDGLARLTTGFAPPPPLIKIARLRAQPRLSQDPDGALGNSDASI